MMILVRMCEAARFDRMETYVTSGNVVFRNSGSEDQVRSGLEAELQT